MSTILQTTLCKMCRQQCISFSGLRGMREGLQQQALPRRQLMQQLLLARQAWQPRLLRQALGRHGG